MAFPAGQAVRCLAQGKVKQRLVTHPLEIPEKLFQTCVETHGDQGADWLRRVPGMARHCAEQWALTLDAPLADVSYNYVAPGLRADGVGIVLKICYPSHEFATEVHALELFAGCGACSPLRGR